jgi:hypothetical protein
MKPMSDEWIEAVCRRGQGEHACAFLALSAGWECAKGMPGVATVIRRRLDEGTMKAQGDHCSGPPQYIEAVPA